MEAEDRPTRIAQAVRAIHPAKTHVRESTIRDPARVTRVALALVADPAYLSRENACIAFKREQDELLSVRMQEALGKLAAPKREYVEERCRQEGLVQSDGMHVLQVLSETEPPDITPLPIAQKRR